MPNDTSTQDSSFSKDRRPVAEAQGQAALLLLESLLHSLLDNGSLTKAQALECFDSALDVKEESAAEDKEPRHVLRKSLQLLNQMRASIEHKSGRYDTAPAKAEIG